MNSTHFASSENRVEPLDEEAFEYLEWLEEQALSERSEIMNFQRTA